MTVNFTVSLMLSLNIKHLGPDKVITLSDDNSLKTLLVGNVGPKRGRQIGDSMTVIVSLMYSLNIKHIGPNKVITLSDDYSIKTLLVGNVGPKRLESVKERF
jgi:hypothetical protein